MREFFRTWRRKLGVIVLLTACVFAGGWVRSRQVEDTFDFIFGDRMVLECHSTDCGVMWIFTWNSNTSHQEETQNGVRFTHKVLTRPFGWRVFATGSRANWISLPSHVANNDEGEVDYGYARTTPAPRWYMNWIGLRLGMEGTSNVRGMVVTVPYWLLVIPLTVVSASLLLLMSRPGAKG